MQDSPLEIDLTMTRIGDSEFLMSADLTEVAPITTTNNVVTFVMTIWLPYSEENPWYYPVIDKSEDMEYLDNDQKSHYEFVSNTFIYDDWNIEDLRGVVFVQSLDNLEIIQAAQVTLTTDNNDSFQSLDVASLKQNYPNPFSLNANSRSKTTRIKYSVNTPGNVELSIFNSKGQKITTLVNEYSDKGDFTESWDGTDLHGNTVVSGIYFYKLNTVEGSETKKMLIIK